MRCRAASAATALWICVSTAVSRSGVGVGACKKRHALSSESPSLSISKDNMVERGTGGWDGIG
jgi:hypothetical protein